MDSAGEAATLSHRAEVFRTKLIEDFQILESISEQGMLKAPVYNSSNVTSKHGGLGYCIDSLTLCAWLMYMQLVP